MKNRGIRRSSILTTAVLWAVSLIGTPFAGAAWHFDWNCSSRMGTGGGREGPYSGRQGCENDLARARAACEAGPSGASFSGNCVGSDDAGGGTGAYAGQPSGDSQTAWMQQQEAEMRLRLQVEAEEARRALEARQRQADAEWLRREAEASREKFAAEKQQALGSLKGEGGTLRIKGGTAFFGLKGAPDADWKAQAGQGWFIASAWKQLHCGQSIMQFAFAAARDAKAPEEMRYLAGQAIAAMTGEPIGVACPETPDMPAVYSESDPEVRSVVIRFYTGLLAAAQKQVDRAVAAERIIAAAEAKRASARLAVAQEEKRAAGIEAEAQKRKEALAAGGTQPGRTPAQAEDKGALEEALRAREAAIRAAADVDRAVEMEIGAARRERTDALQAIDGYEKMFQTVQADPEKASARLRELGLEGPAQ